MQTFFVEIKCALGKTYAVASALAEAEIASELYSIAGDCYAKLGKDTEARRYYNLSLAADPTLNYWALTGLAGE